MGKKPCKPRLDSSSKLTTDLYTQRLESPVRPVLSDKQQKNIIMAEAHGSMSYKPTQMGLWTKGQSNLAKAATNALHAVYL